MTDWNELRSALAASKEELVGLRAREELMRERRQALETMVGLAKGRAALQPQLLEHLQDLQALTHQKSVGVYEELLSAIVNDVLPGDRKVVLELTTERSLPALDIEVDKGGRRETISGGAVTNIVSAGLRVIALARSGHYPFMVLDEPDCWLKPSRVPQFASVLGQIAGEIGIQALLISHHEASFFDQIASMAKLVRRGGKIESERVGDEEPWPEGRSGIKAIWLKNFMSHEMTRIELGPGITCLTGENDIGKSAVAVALRALFYGDSKDAYISHEKDSFEVGVEFSDGNRLSLTHWRKKSPKRQWAFFVPGAAEAAMTGSPKAGAPSWLADVAKIERSGGMDIALTDQKKPVFLLEETPSQRAAILSVGRESGHLQRMIAKNRQKAADDGMLIREGEKEAAHIDRQLKALVGLSALLQGSRQLEANLGVIQAEAEAVSRAVERSERLERLEALAALAPAMERSATPKAPALIDLSKLVGGIDRLGALERRASVECRAMAPEAPKVESWEAALRSTRRLEELERVARLALSATPPEAPALAEWESSARRVEALARAERLAGISIPAGAPEAPTLESWREGMEKAERLAKAQKVAELSLAASAPEAPKLLSGLVIEQSLQLREAWEQKIAKFEALDRERERREALLADRAEALATALGGVCPCCRQSVSAKHLINGGAHGAA